MRFATILFLLFTAVLSLRCRAIHADIVEEVYQGEITDEQFTTGMQSALAIGTLVRQRIVYDTDTLKAIIDGGRARFSNAILAYDITIAGVAFTLDNPADVFIDNNSISNFDAFRISNTDFKEEVLIGGMTITDAGIAFIDDTQAAFGSTDLPLSLPSGSFSLISSRLSFETLDRSAATIYTVRNTVSVPEPTSLSILFFSFAAAFRRRRSEAV